MSQELTWKNLNKTNIKQAAGDSTISILAVRRDGKGYYGHVVDVNDNYVELANGDHRQNLYFHLHPMQFTIIENPPPPTFKMGNPRFNFDRH